MGFIGIENYNGEQGYLKGSMEALPLVEMSGKKYLVSTDIGMDNFGKAYRIIKEGADTALGTLVTNGRKVRALQNKWAKDIEKMVDEHLEEHDDLLELIR